MNAFNNGLFESPLVLNKFFLTSQNLPEKNLVRREPEVCDGSPISYTRWRLWSKGRLIFIFVQFTHWYCSNLS